MFLLPRTKAFSSSPVCPRCLFRLSAQRPISIMHPLHSSTQAIPVNIPPELPPPPPTPLPPHPTRWQVEYFLSNTFPRKDASSKDPTTPTPRPLPHRRRQLLLHRPTDLPLKSTTLKHHLKALHPYLALSKPRLTALIVLSAMAPYALYPTNPLLLSTATPTLSATTLLFLTSGTALTSASANALNMLLEPSYDAQMTRTRNRPLVRGLLSSRQALLFAAGTGMLGVCGLYTCVNPTVAMLAAGNILLYAGVYTPLKRVSVVNTWIGAIVGGIPPLMGWAAAAGNFQGVDDSWLSTLSHPGAWLLAGLLFVWQFPHFNSLSWSIREEYKAAGYQMLAWKDPARNARVALRYSVMVFPICAGLWACGVTDVGFLVTSSGVNAWLVGEAWRFWKDSGERGSAKRLFWASVWHLPVVMGLAMLHKAGLWRGVWESIVGHDQDEDGGEEG